MSLRVGIELAMASVDRTCMESGGEVETGRRARRSRCHRTARDSCSPVCAAIDNSCGCGLGPGGGYAHSRHGASLGSILFSGWALDRYWSRGAFWKSTRRWRAPAKICQARLPFGASWGTDDAIVFADEPDGGLRRVAAAGGVEQVLTTVDLSKGEGGHALPHVLPGAKAILFTVVAVPNAPRLGTYVALLSLETGERRVLFRDVSDARYVPTGHLVYVAGQTLMAAPFDLGRLRVTGDSVGLLDGVMRGIKDKIISTVAAHEHGVRFGLACLVA